MSRSNARIGGKGYDRGAWDRTDLTELQGDNAGSTDDSQLGPVIIDAGNTFMVRREVGFGARIDGSIGSTTTGTVTRAIIAKMPSVDYWLERAILRLTGDISNANADKSMTFSVQIEDQSGPTWEDVLNFTIPNGDFTGTDYFSADGGADRNIFGNYNDRAGQVVDENGVLWEGDVVAGSDSLPGLISMGANSRYREAPVRLQVAPVGGSGWALTAEVFLFGRILG